MPPRGFQFGIGRDIIRPLDASSLDDKETGSLWYPIEKGLKGIQGPYFNRLLPEIKSEDTNLGQRVETHPHTRVAH